MADQPVEIDEVRNAAGRVILDLTDRFGFDAFAAGWLHDRGSGAWRYLLVTPYLAMAERSAPPGLSVLVTHDVLVNHFLLGNGFMAFYRRLPLQLRRRKPDPARKFDTRGRPLDQAA